MKERRAKCRRDPAQQKPIKGFTTGFGNWAAAASASVIGMEMGSLVSRLINLGQILGLQDPAPRASRTSGLSGAPPGTG